MNEIGQNRQNGRKENPTNNRQKKNRDKNKTLKKIFSFLSQFLSLEILRNFDDDLIGNF